MRNLILTYLILLIVLASAAVGCSSDTLTENEFSEIWIESLTNKNENLVVKEVNGLELKTEINNEEYTHFLDNAYADYKNDPSDLDNIIENYAESSLDLFKPKKKINHNKIVPLIRDKRYLAEIKRLNDTDTLSNIFEEYNDDLIIIYAEDNERTISQFTKEDIATLNIAVDSFKGLSISNLNTILPEIEKTGNTGLYMLTAGGDYESSLILLDDIWTKDNFDVDGDFVIGIPSRDMLMITGSNDKENILKLKNIVKDINTNGSHIVSDKLFIRENQKFVVYKK
jgi:uncharacterized protein YtpQ (UPF0354 family)